MIDIKDSRHILRIYMMNPAGRKRQAGAFINEH